MYFAVVKLTFEGQTPVSRTDQHDVRALVESLRKRFKVCAAVCSPGTGSISLAITALASSEEQLSRTLDKISNYCEEAGIGRIESEEALMDHVDHIGEFCAR